MPPGNTPRTSIDTDHLLPPARKKSSGAIVGIVIIVLLMIFGALYFWGAQLNQKVRENNLPFISAQHSTATP